MPTVLSSASNPLVQRLAQLGQARGRQELGLFLVEGQRAIADFLAAGWIPVHLLLQEDRELPPNWPESLLQRASARVVARISQATTPSGFLAAFAPRTPPAFDPALGGLVLAGVSDPGNTGTLIRTAAALAIAQVVVVGGADPFGPKAVQASAGALARIALHRWPLQEPSPAEPAPADAPEPSAHSAFSASSAPWCALVPRGGIAPEALPRIPRFLVVGGEAHGIPAEVQERCSEQVTLPMPGGTESLNAAIAGSVAAYLLLRGAR